MNFFVKDAQSSLVCGRHKINSINLGYYPMYIDASGGDEISAHFHSQGGDQ